MITGKHIFNVGCVLPVLPEDAPDGLRRSRRVRCQPVAWYKGERLVYERRKSGEVTSCILEYISLYHCTIIHVKMHQFLKLCRISFIH